jgi:hypothetical protein
MDKAFSLLSGVLNRRGLKSHADAALAVHKARRWLDARLPACKEALRISKIADGVLSIECDHAVVLQECAGIVPEMKDFMAKECPFLPITDIRITRK